MGIPSVTRFLSKINNSISSGNLYDIEFSFPPQPAFKGGKPSLGDWLARATNPPDSGRKTARLDGELISMLANEVQIPGVNMTSQDVRSVKKGINMKPAMAKVYNEMDLSFILDVNSTPMRFFKHGRITSQVTLKVLVSLVILMVPSLLRKRSKHLLLLSTMIMCAM